MTSRSTVVEATTSGTPSFDDNYNPIDPAPDTHFNGLKAVAAFDAAGGSSYTGAKVPVENMGGSGNRDSHWRESVLDNELMTTHIVLSSENNPLSAITIQAMADIGYSVDVTQADAYTLPPIRGQNRQVVREASDPSQLHRQKPHHHF